MNNEKIYEIFISTIIGLSIVWFIWFFIKQNNYNLYLK